jgi:hypothetical protein
VKAVSDTSPLGYLILIAQSELLPKTFSSISIPEQVRDELLDDVKALLVVFVVLAGAFY